MKEEREATKERRPPYWVLMSVLASSQPLTPVLATCLHQAATDLFRRNAPMGPVAGDLFSGRVVNLRKNALLGTIGGPVFEAHIETARGKGFVRFLLTREGLALAEEEPGRELAN